MESYAIMMFFYVFLFLFLFFFLSYLFWVHVHVSYNVNRKSLFILDFWLFNIRESIREGWIASKKWIYWFFLNWLNSRYDDLLQGQDFFFFHLSFIDGRKVRAQPWMNVANFFSSKKLLGTILFCMEISGAWSKHIFD